MTKAYTGKDIQVLEGLDAVRKRPGMYVGGTGAPGLMHCIWEILDNAVDEAIAGHCTRIEIALHSDGSIEVADNGRGIPVDVEPKTGLAAVEVVFTVLHAGGKFGGGSYASAGGLHGVGSSVVNALSSRLDATVCRDGVRHQISFHRGVTGVFTGDGPDAPFSKKPGTRAAGKAPKGHTGTTVRFWPDRSIFAKDAEVDPEKVIAKARQSAFLVPGLAIQVRDLTGAAPKEETFCFKGGVKDMCEFMSHGKPVCEAVHITGTGTFTETVPVLDAAGHMATTDVERSVQVDVALKWDAGYETTVQSFVNVVATPKGGTHVKGFERGLLQAIRKGYEGTRIMRQNEDPVLLDDVLEGLTAIVSVGFPEPQFDGQTKEVLGTPGVTRIVADVVSAGVRAWLDGRKKAQARLVLEKAAAAARARVAARTQREAARRKTSLESASMPAKLVDCRTTGVSRSEIFIVEGDSALGCFTGDTLVATTGGPVTFERLVADWARGTRHTGYAASPDGTIIEAQLHEPRMTFESAPLVAVTLDGCDPVRCTPDHLFRLPSGAYQRADALAPGDRVATAKPGGDVAVVSVVEGGLAPVFDLTVERFHNFALGCGALVHNSARAARNSEYQAMLPIRGKILNVQKATLAQALANAECASIIQVIGAGSGRTFSLEQMRYHKIILMADADVDGSHIRSLLIVLIAKLMRPIIEAGRLYAAVPPLYKIETTGRAKETLYAYSTAQMEQLVARLEKSGKQVRKPVPRFKGLGEMNADELWDTTMDPATRTVRQVTMQDAEAAERTMDLLFGDQVAPRREWIIQNAHRLDPAAIDA